MKIKLPTVSAGILFLVCLSIGAENNGPAGIWLDINSMTPIQLPAAGDIPDILENFEYDGDAVPFAFADDLNGDGRKEFLIVVSVEQCGTGGCPYALVDGKSLRRIGDFFGSPILVASQKINGYPVMHSYSHASAGSGTFTTFVYGGNSYQAVSAVFLAGESVAILFKSLVAYKTIMAQKEDKDK